jgi:hypothetical protein
VNGAEQALATLRDYVERSTHWKEGGADRHSALLALRALESSPTHDVRDALSKIVGAYDAYRRRGVAPAPVEYAAVVDAIDRARSALKP